MDGTEPDTFANPEPDIRNRIDTVRAPEPRELIDVGRQEIGKRRH
ncbi:hypothetical protein GLA29479_3217 [Lysobacter antibioticus]|nr:hypothetical protein GLA29479_3217 [Lysobacter antibioticus]